MPSLHLEPQWTTLLSVDPPSPSEHAVSPCSIASAPLRTPEHLRFAAYPSPTEARRPDSAHAGTGTPRSAYASTLLSTGPRARKRLENSDLLRSPLVSMANANSPRSMLSVCRASYSSEMSTIKLPATPPQQTQRNWLQVHEVLTPTPSPSPRDIQSESMQAQPQIMHQQSRMPAKWVDQQLMESDVLDSRILEQDHTSPTASMHMSPASTTSSQGVVRQPSSDPSLCEGLARCRTEQKQPLPSERKSFIEAVGSFVRRLSGVSSHQSRADAQGSCRNQPWNVSDGHRRNISTIDGLDLEVPGAFNVNGESRESVPPVARALDLGDGSGRLSGKRFVTTSTQPDGMQSASGTNETLMLRQHVSMLERQVKELTEKLSLLEDVEARLAVVEVASNMPRSKSMQPMKMINFGSGLGRKRPGREVRL